MKSSPSPSQQAGTVKVLVQNVLTGNRKHQSVLDWIDQEDPDVVILLETANDWFDSCAALHEEYPYRIEQAHPGNFGVSFYSRIPCRKEVKNYGEYQLPVVIADFKLNETLELQIACVHPLPPMRPRTMRERDGLLNAVIEDLDPNQVHLMTGDFNMTPWSPKFKRLLKSGDLVDAAQGHGPEPTWYLGPTWLGGLKLDHALVSPGIRVIDFRIGPANGSDHRGLVIELGVD